MELVIGSDFGAGLTAGAQAQKIILLEAQRAGERQYEIHAKGRNERLVRGHGPGMRWRELRRGWTAPEMARSLAEDARVTVMAFDFPFSLPVELFRSGEFAVRVGRTEAFGTRAEWVRFLGERVALEFTTERATAKLRFGEELNAWRDTAFWLLRETDRVVKAQPSLKHKFQNVFQMTLVGSQVLARLEQAGVRLGLEPNEFGGARMALETFPGGVARAVGFGRNYKCDPAGSMARAEEYLRERGIELAFDARVREFCLTYRTPGDDPDGADAFLCLVTAIAYREGMAEWHRGLASDEVLKEEGCVVTPARAGAKA